MYALIFTVFVDLVGFGIVLPLLPLYAQSFGASPELVTLVAASYTAAQAIFGPMWGRLSDRFGRKPILLMTLAGTFLAYALLAMTDTLLMLFAVRFFGGAMAANMSVAHALVADVTRPEERTRAIARLSGAAGLGFIAGPAIGGFFAHWGSGAPNFVAPYAAAAAFSAAAFVLAIVLIRESVSAESRGHARAARGFAAWGAVLRRSQTRLVLFLMFLTPAVFAGIEVILVLWTARTLGWGPDQNGYLYTWMGFCHMTAQWFVVGRLAGLLGERALIGAGAVSLGLGVFWMPLAGSVPELYAATALMIFGVSANNSSLSALLSQYAGAHSRGQVLGLGQSFAGAGRIFGPILAGFLFAQAGIGWPFYAGALAMAAMAVLSRGIAARRASDVVREEVP